ncbi:MAG: type III-B CRISPR module RAMP protein Cmr4 [Bacteroidales bacterium]
MSIEFIPYFIQCVTNMHVGSGDASYGIVDKLVQRDPVTRFPTIHASSLKGALREHFEKKDPLNKEILEYIFGKENKDSNNDHKTQPGQYVFFSADLVALPLRSTYQQFVMASAPLVFDILNKKARYLGNQDIFTLDDNTIARKIYLASTPENTTIIVEDEEFQSDKKPDFDILQLPSSLKGLLNQRFAMLTDDAIQNYVENLPVLARNALNNGISVNLWYEEIVPHQTVFLTYFGMADQHKDTFCRIIENDLIQIGGNASLGYGLCKFVKLN